MIVMRMTIIMLALCVAYAEHEGQRKENRCFDLVLASSNEPRSHSKALLEKSGATVHTLSVTCKS